MYGFDTASSLGEETVNPRKTAPSAILRAILASFVIGGAILVFAILAAPNLSDPKLGQQGGLQQIVLDVMYGPVGKIFLICIVVAVFVCTLAVHTAAIRLTFAMARDNALPFGESLAKVHPRTQGAGHPVGADRGPVDPDPGHQHQPADDLPAADLGGHHHDLHRLPDGDGSVAAQAVPRSVAAAGPEVGWVLHDGTLGPAGEHRRRAVGHRDGHQPRVAARGPSTALPGTTPGPRSSTSASSGASG